MQTYKPDLTEKEHEIRETINQRFLNSFEETGKTNPRNAKETCDLHLSGKQPVLYLTPKKQGIKDILWNEPIDRKLFWSNKNKLWWGIIAINSIIFFLLIYYFWGVI